MFRRSTARVFHIGLDDTDSSEGMCTTFLTYKLVRKLLGMGQTRLVDYPNLIRLNPNIPWKTRGNAALAVRVESNLTRSRLLGTCKKFVKAFATSPHANAGLVIFEGQTIPESVIQFSKRALYEVLGLRLAKSLILEEEGFAFFHLRSGQGLVGALAAIGNELLDDHTFELIAYRRNCALKRKLDQSRVISMDRKTAPLTFNSYDRTTKRILIMPHGPDPVLLGIRGETPNAVREAFQMLLPVENLQGYMIFRTNQGTGVHLGNSIDLAAPKAYTSGRVEGVVARAPTIERGGHVYFSLKNQCGHILCAAYEPTGTFRKDILSLAPGDRIEVGGGIRKGTSIHPKVLNLEYMVPQKLTKLAVERNPKCPECFATLASEGRKKGYRCSKCGIRSIVLQKFKQEIPRTLSEGRLYLPDLKAHRHLTKPKQRYEIPFRKYEPIVLSDKSSLIRNWTNN